METFKNYLRIILNIVIPLTVIILVFYFGPKLIGFFMPFVIGWIIAMIGNPLVRFLENRLKIVRKASSLAIVVAVLALIVISGYFLLSKLVTEFVHFIRDFQVIYETAEHDIQNIILNFSGILERLPNGVQNTITDFSNNIGNYISQWINGISIPTFEAAGNMAKSIPNLLVQVVVTIISSYFFIAESDKITDYLKKFMPKALAEYGHLVKSNTKRVVGGYFLAQFKIMMVVAAILVVGFFFLRIEYAFFLAILIAFLDFLPVFGTGTVLIPWSLIKFFNGDYYIAIGLAILYVVTQVVRQVIQPKIVGDSMGINPLLTLFLLYIGFQFRGIAGMILAVPIGLIVIEFYKFGAFDTLIGSVKELIFEINSFRKKKG